MPGSCTADSSFMTKYLTLLLFIGLAWGQSPTTDNEIGRQFWTLILLILVIRGGIKVGKWEGSKKRIRLYRIALPLFSFISIAFFGVIVGIQPAIKMPLFYTLLQIIILHLGMKNKALKWANASKSLLSNETITENSVASIPKENDLKEELEKFKELLEKDLITQSDYDTKKKELLNL